MIPALVVYLIAALGIFLVASDSWVPGDGPWPFVWAILWPLGVVAALIGLIWDVIDMMLRRNK